MVCVEDWQIQIIFKQGNQYRVRTFVYAWRRLRARYMHGCNRARSLWRPVLPALKTSENLWFSVFRGIKKEHWKEKGLGLGFNSNMLYLYTLYFLHGNELFQLLG